MHLEVYFENCSIRKISYHNSVEVLTTSSAMQHFLPMAQLGKWVKDFLAQINFYWPDKHGVNQPKFNGRRWISSAKLLVELYNYHMVRVGHHFPHSLLLRDQSGWQPRLIGISRPPVPHPPGLHLAGYLQPAL